MIVDLFAGGGGASLGIQWATGRSPDLAVNHDEHAIRMHAANHPDTHHEEASVWEIRPREACAGRDVELLWLSPDCRHFSKAKGGAKVSPRIRTLARVAIPWARQVRPQIICLENVEEFTTWGPLVDERPDPRRSGLYFRRWVRDLEREGYAVDWRILNAADFGAPTSRRRLFLVARADGLPPQWPEPTHGPRKGLEPYRTAAECIDWSIPCPSIFGRDRPLAEATQRRIAAGLVRFVLEAREPAFIVGAGGPIYSGKPRPLSSPFQTLLTENHSALIVPWIAKHYSGVIGQQLNLPLGTVTTIDHHSLCTATTGEQGVERVVAWIERYYSSGGHSSNIQLPLPTITTVDRMALVVARIRELGIVDIGMRMLQPRELARAQGFPDSYVLTGTQRDQVGRIGNSVCPHAAASVVAANWSEAMERAA